MKKLIVFIALFIFIGSTAEAAEKLKNIKSVNGLIKKGYKLVSTNTYVHAAGGGGIIYNLIKGDDLISCVLNNPRASFTNPNVRCLRP